MSHCSARIRPCQAPACPRIHEAAIEYAGCGLAPIPLRPLSKEPALTGWPGATCDPGEVDERFRDHDGNIGIVMGRGVFALDVDPRNGGGRSFRALAKGGLGLPRTAHARTGGGGDHYLFRVDPSLVVAKRPLDPDRLPGLDTVGVGGYIVAEPSVHPTTQREYVWLRCPQQGIADCPVWLVASWRISAAS